MSDALIIEDDPNALSAMAELVRQEGFEVRTAPDLATARAALRTRKPQVILSDLILPDGRGTDLLEELIGETGLDIILITGNATVETTLEALRLGAYDYLTKPVDRSRLKMLLAGLRRTRHLKTEISSLRQQLRQLGRFGPMVGISPTMQRVYEMIERVAPTDASVLLTGESGTGKELAAQAIHTLSARSVEPFVAINCGAVSPTLIESQLFGHEKGAFTGAVKRHEGCFEQADRGTLLLDEITEMSMELQVKLLRVLETRTIQRVGGTETRKVDVRVIAATNRSPEQAVLDGQMRQDLLYRLKVFPIEMPPLRHRLEDVELLSLYFVVDLGMIAGQRKSITTGALQKLRRYTWPGNVRQLKNVLRQAFIMADHQITEACLPKELTEEPGALGPGLRLEVGMSVADAEQRLILATLEELEGDKRQAASLLGISLKTLYNRLHSYAAEEESAQERENS